MKDIAVSVPPMTPRREFMRIARLASEMGYHSVWTYEEFHADPMVRLGECLQQTDLKIGTGCLNPFLRTPLGIAMTYMTLEAMFPGRTILGLGVGLAFWLDRAGVNTRLTHSGVREAVKIIRGLFAGETVNLDGRFFKVHDLKIMLPPTPHIPIYLAPRENLTFAEICGEIGDGCFGPIGVSNRYHQKLFDHVRIGLRRSGRKESDYVFANNFWSRIAIRSRRKRRCSAIRGSPTRSKSRVISRPGANAASIPNCLSRTRRPRRAAIGQRRRGWSGTPTPIATSRSAARAKSWPSRFSRRMNCWDSTCRCFRSARITSGRFSKPSKAGGSTPSRVRTAGGFDGAANLSHQR
jgi:hypothetical protein